MAVKQGCWACVKLVPAGLALSDLAPPARAPQWHNEAVRCEIATGDPTPHLVPPPAHRFVAKCRAILVRQNPLRGNLPTHFPMYFLLVHRQLMTEKPTALCADVRVTRRENSPNRESGR